MNRKTSTMNFRQLSTLFLLLLMVGSLLSQNFSILTCSRGDEIYSTFGHSAIRFQDSAQGIDWVYNYGLFDFHDPNFIPKFCMGKLDYMVGKESMNDFMGQYVYQQREVKEQVLNLQPSQRDSLLRFLEWNILDENKYYRYDFLFNNCATKIIEVIENNCKGAQMRFFDEEKKKSFRQHIHNNASSSVPWIDWGMDLALGMSVDRKANSREYCFLPEYVAKSISLSQSNGLPLVVSETILIPETIRETSYGSWLYSPLLFALIIFALAFYLKYNSPSWSKYFFVVLYSFIGLGGLVIGFEWFFTEHSVTKNNLNLLWLNPLCIPYAYALYKEKKWNTLEKILGVCITMAFLNSFIKIQSVHMESNAIISSIFLHLNVFTTFKINREQRKEICS